MLDVEARAPMGPADGQPYGPDRAAWVDERRPLLIAGAFAAAVLLGVLIGLLTAPDGANGEASELTATTAPELRPPLPVVDWNASRLPGRAHQMLVRDGDGVRPALQFAVAAKLREASGTERPAAADVSVPTGMFYGAVEGIDAARDEYWAVGETQVTGVAEQPADPFVWRRVGDGPWTIVGSGAGACSALPPALLGPDAWKGTPRQCTSA